MLLLKSLPSSYTYFITPLKAMPMIEMTVRYVMACLMYEMSKKKEREPKGDDATMVLHQDKMDNPLWCKDVKMCYYYDNLGHITLFYHKTKDDHQKNANNT